MESSLQTQEPDNPDSIEPSSNPQQEASREPSREPSTITPETIANDPDAKLEDEEALLGDLGRAKKYSKISNEKRMQLINSVENDGEKIKQAAKTLDINYSSAKSILQVFKKEGRSDKKAFKKRIGKDQQTEANIGEDTAFHLSSKNDNQVIPQGSKNESDNLKGALPTQENVQQKDTLTELKERLLESRLGKRQNPYSDTKNEALNKSETSYESNDNQTIKVETSTKASQTTNEGQSQSQTTYLYMNQHGQLFSSPQALMAQESSNAYQQQQQQQQQQNYYFHQNQQVFQQESNNNQNGTNQTPQSQINQQDSNQKFKVDNSHVQNQPNTFQSNTNQAKNSNQQQTKLMNSNESQNITYGYQANQGTYLYLPQTNQAQYYPVPMQNVMVGQYGNQPMNQYQFVQQPMLMMNQNNNQQNYSMQAFQIGGNYIPQQNSYIFVGQNQNSSLQPSTESNKVQTIQMQQNNQNDNDANNRVKNEMKKP